jgi:hypothetical protein
MAVFILELAFSSIVYDKNRDSLEEEITRLKSMRRKLTRRYRTLKKESTDELSQCHTVMHQLRSLVADQEERLVTKNEKMKLSHCLKSEARANPFDEIVELAQTQGVRRYLNNLYYMAVVIMFCSRSTYQLLRNFIPLPSRTSGYAHFGATLRMSRSRLESLDQVVVFVSSRITRHPDIAARSLLAVDAISCSNTFVAMKRLEMSDAAYLFVVYL